MAANREAQRKATHNEGGYSVQQMYMYVRGHNQIEAFPQSTVTKL